MKQAIPNAAKVGLLVIVATALLYAVVVFLGGRFARHGKTFYVHMEDGGGVTKGTRVTMAGVRIGEIEDIKLLNPRSVLLTLEIGDDFNIPAGSTAVVPTSFISLGDTGLIIVPPLTIAENLEPGSRIEGSHPGPLDNIFPNTQETIKTLNETLAAARDLLRDQDLKGGVKKLLETADSTLSRFEKLAASTQGVLDRNSGVIDSAVRNASLAMSDVRKSARLAYNLINDGHYQEQVKTLLNRLDSTSAKAEKLISDMDAFVGDPNLKKSLNTTLRNAEDISETGKTIAANTTAITRNGIELSKQAISLTQRASEVADEAKALLGKMEGLVDNVSGKVDKFTGKLSGVKTPVSGVRTEIDLLRDTKPSYNRLDMNVNAHLFGADTYLGLFDAGGSNKLNFQFGLGLGDSVTARYGFYAGAPGVGVDYRVAPHLSLKTDVYGLNKTRFDALAKIEFGGGFVSWIGFDRIFDRNGITAGVGWEK